MTVASHVVVKDGEPTVSLGPQVAQPEDDALCNCGHLASEHDEEGVCVVVWERFLTFGYCPCMEFRGRPA